MDKLYTGDIPKDYHYAIFSDNHVDLYNQNVAQNVTLPYYRIYYNAPSFVYSRGVTNFGLLNQYTFQDVEVTDEWYYRNDNLTILSFTVVICLVVLWFTNIFTSIFKKGGIFNG